MRPRAPVPGECYCRRLRSLLLLLCDSFWVQMCSMSLALVTLLSSCQCHQLSSPISVLVGVVSSPHPSQFWLVLRSNVYIHMFCKLQHMNKHINMQSTVLWCACQKTRRRSKQAKTIRDFYVDKALRKKSFVCEVLCDCSQHILEINKTKRKKPTRREKEKKKKRFLRQNYITGFKVSCYWICYVNGVALAAQHLRFYWQAVDAPSLTSLKPKLLEAWEGHCASALVTMTVTVF